jgi:lactoylglutathione lyase
MKKIEHIALWTKNLERMKDFYVEFFDGRANEKYVNRKTGFESYFMAFDSGARLEIMYKSSIPENRNDVDTQYTGYIHVAISTGSRESVDELTNRLRERGYRVVSEARQTGDGYYESCVLDPDGNRIEITA